MPGHNPARPSANLIAAGERLVSINIRPADPGDVDAILAFIRGLARYEHAEKEVVATTADLDAALFGANAKVHCLIAETGNTSVGCAIYFYNFSTWIGKYGIYLEDLFVEEAHRGAGAGLALMQALATIAIDEGCTRFEWSVLDWNQPSIDFYERLGAEAQSEWIGYRMSGDVLAQLAAL
tara:strand:- start:1102 stop:1641 length:540 start_codon:yes stop_codon:yes gene_type:complete